LHLDKSQSRERWSEVRALWNEWDPIGVSDAVDDEYDSYLGPTLRLLENDASTEEIERYLAFVVLDRMGMSDVPDGPPNRRQFALKLRTWYQTKWPESTV
jgi:hypothetical protein